MRLAPGFFLPVFLCGTLWNINRQEFNHETMVQKWNLDTENSRRPLHGAGVAGIVPARGHGRKVAGPFDCNEGGEKVRKRDFTFSEWCKFRGISRQTGYRLIHAGKIDTYKIGRRRFVSIEADRDFIKQAMRCESGRLV